MGEGSLRARISETISDTLRRAGRRKKTRVRCDIPNFLFVNKPHFSSDESLADQRRELERLSRQGRRTRGISEPREVGGHQYRSQLMLRVPSRPDLVTVTPPSPTTSRAPTTTRERRARSLSGASPAPQLSLALDQARGDYVVYSEASGVRKKSRARRVAP